MGDTPQDLLEAICLAPDEDILRERYANMIEGTDPAHAELIRLQLARFARERADGIVSSRSEGREAELIREHGARWSRYFAVFVEEGAAPGSKQLTFVRGFIGHAALRIENVVGLGERLYMFAPIQHLDVRAGSGDIKRLFAVPGAPGESPGAEARRSRGHRQSARRSGRCPSRRDLRRDGAPDRRVDLTARVFTRAQFRARMPPWVSKHGSGKNASPP
jgi:uncharacterized protein (TIGR02996 family)